MRLLVQCWHRIFDRELDQTVALPDRDSMSPADWNQFVGSTGERLARKALWRTGRKVLYHNYRPENGTGEVDVVYRDKNTLVFGEVKTRTRGEFGEPARAVDKAKQRLIIRGGNAWLSELNDPEVLFRYDVIEVLLRDDEVPAVRINEGAFTNPQKGLGQ